MNPPSGHEDSAAEPGAKTIIAGLDAQVPIHLWEDRTRGELWVPVYDPSELVLVSDDFLRIANGNAVESGRRTFAFKPVVAGIHRIVFEKRMGWKFTAEDRRVFQLVVSSGASQTGER